MNGEDKRLENIKKGGFKNNPQNINRRGSAKKLTSQLKGYFLEEHHVRMSNADASDLIMAVLSMTTPQIEELVKRDDVPFWLNLIANKAIRDRKKGSAHIIEILMDRVFGKPKESVTTTMLMPDPVINVEVIASDIPLASSEDQIQDV